MNSETDENGNKRETDYFVSMPLSQQDEFGDDFAYDYLNNILGSQCRSRSKMNSENLLRTIKYDKFVSLNAALAAR